MLSYSTTRCLSVMQVGRCPQSYITVYLTKCKTLIQESTLQFYNMKDLLQGYCWPNSMTLNAMFRYLKDTVMWLQSYSVLQCMCGYQSRPPHVQCCLFLEYFTHSKFTFNIYHTLNVIKHTKFPKNVLVMYRFMLSPPRLIITLNNKCC